MWIVDFLFPGYLLLSSRVACFLPKFPASGCLYFLVLGTVRFWRLEVRLHLLPKERWRGFRPTRLVSKRPPKWLFDSVSSVASAPKCLGRAVCCNGGCPEELLPLLLPALHRISTTLPKLRPPFPCLPKLPWWLSTEVSSLPVDGGTFGSENPNLLARLTPSVSRVCDQHFARI